MHDRLMRVCRKALLFIGWLLYYYSFKARDVYSLKNDEVFKNSN